MILKISSTSQTNTFSTCRLASEGPFCRVQADKVLKAFTTWASGTRLDKKTTNSDFASCSATWFMRSLNIWLPHFLLPLQVLSICLWIQILLEVVADVHQNLPINEISKTDYSLEIKQLLSYTKVSGFATRYLPLELRCKCLQKIVMFSVNTNEDQICRLGCCSMAHHLCNTSKHNTVAKRHAHEMHQHPR